MLILRYPTSRGKSRPLCGTGIAGGAVTFYYGWTIVGVSFVSAAFWFGIRSSFSIFGMGLGVTAPMVMSAAADLFQGRMFGMIYGIVEAAIGIGGALGAWVAGFIFDITQTYKGAFGVTEK